MAIYMTQSMSSGTLAVTLYYRKQSIPHPGHAETTQFTTDAKAAYAALHAIPVANVVPAPIVPARGPHQSYRRRDITTSWAVNSG